MKKLTLKDLIQEEKITKVTNSSKIKGGTGKDKPKGKTTVRSVDANEIER